MLNPVRTVSIVCGASEWSGLSQFESAPAFSNSAAALRDYLTGPTGLALPDENVLWLFDAPDAIRQYERIEAFLGQRLATFDAQTGAGVLILFAYIGHGAFFGSGREYCLLVSDTRAPIEAETSLRVSSLSRLLRVRAPESSRVLILDCCFAGEAAHAFQGGLNQAVAVKAEEVVAATGDRGVALFCAASARNPARLESVTTSTLFSLELMRAAATWQPCRCSPTPRRRWRRTTLAVCARPSRRMPGGDERRR